MTITTVMWNDAQARIAALEKNVLVLSKVLAFLYPRASLIVADPVTEQMEKDFQVLVESLPK